MYVATASIAMRTHLKHEQWSAVVTTIFLYRITALHQLTYFFFVSVEIASFNSIFLFPLSTKRADEQEKEKGNNSTAHFHWLTNTNIHHVYTHFLFFFLWKKCFPVFFFTCLLSSFGLVGGQYTGGSRHNNGVLWDYRWRRGRQRMANKDSRRRNRQNTGLRNCWRRADLCRRAFRRVFSQMSQHISFLNECFPTIWTAMWSLVRMRSSVRY